MVPLSEMLRGVHSAFGAEFGAESPVTEEDGTGLAVDYHTELEDFEF